MKWRCALIQRWLPAYLDGDLPSFWRARLGAHLEGCPGCRDELAGLKTVAQALKAAPDPDPGPDFWESFNRELHLKLARLAPAPEPARFLSLPYYLLGAPALALVLFLAFSHWGLSPKPPVIAQAPAALQAPVTAQAAPSQSAAEHTPAQVVYVGMDDGIWQGEEVPSWDVDAVMADLTHQEREEVLKKFEKD